MENKIIEQYEQGHYNPLGADGGVLKYISCTIDNKIVHANITLDSEIGEIRKIWALEIDGKEIYDYTSKYYKLRN